MAAWYASTKHKRLAPTYLVYKIINEKNGKFYIGITKLHLLLRLKSHLSSAKRGRKGRLPSALRRYGAKAFSIEQIDTAQDLEEANHKERTYIKTLQPFYNLTEGGEGTAGFSSPKTNEWKQIMAETTKKRWENPEDRFKMSMASSRGNKKSKTEISSVKSGAIHSGRDTYWTPERRSFRALLSVKSKALLYKIECPDGSIVETENLKSFCKARGIDNSNLNKTAPGRVWYGSRHKGYRLLESGKRKFVSLMSVAAFLKVSNTSARNLRRNNPVFFQRVVEEMKKAGKVPNDIPAFPAQ